MARSKIVASYRAQHIQKARDHRDRINAEGGQSFIAHALLRYVDTYGMVRHGDHYLVHVNPPKRAERSAA